jgi:hypothetical protein
MDTWILKPAPGHSVRKQNGEQLKTAGERVPKNTYYQRRVNEGGAVEVKKPTQKPKRV